MPGASQIPFAAFARSRLRLLGEAWLRLSALRRHRNLGYGQRRQQQNRKSLHSPTLNKSPPETVELNRDRNSPLVRWIGNLGRRPGKWTSHFPRIPAGFVTALRLYLGRRRL